MKLKKIASLALAGVMAVSMLAGCAGKTGTTDNDTVVDTSASSSVVAAFNDAQDEDADVKVTFSSDSTLEADLKQAIRTKGEGATDTDVESQMRLLNGMKDKNWYTDTTANDEAKAGSTVTNLYVEKFDSSDYWNEKAVVKAAANSFMTSLMEGTGALDENNWKTAVDADKDSYLAYGYTGNVVMVSVTTVDGTTNYYVAYTVTQTVSEKDF